MIISRIFKEILDEFMKVLGGKINKYKIHIYVWNFNSRVATNIAGILQLPMLENWTSLRYLGIPICLQSLPSSTWSHIVEKIKAKFIQWGSQWHNPVNPVVLIKSILSALLIFQFSSLLSPISVKYTIVMSPI
jgi:hypothetical protein